MSKLARHDGHSPTPHFAHHPYHTEGWTLFSDDAASRPIIKRMAAKKEEIFSAVYAVARKHLGPVDFSAYTHEKQRAFEITKAILRAALRTNITAQNLAKSVASHVCQHVAHQPEKMYCTLPYAIIHFPHDLSERGTRHTDGYKYVEEFYTIWTPLNDCFSKPLNLWPKSHPKWRQHLFRVQEHPKLKKIPGVSNLFGAYIQPDIKQGEYLSWYGMTQHQGNENTTAAPTVALVVRVTNTPIMYEPTCAAKHWILKEDADDTPEKDAENFSKTAFEVFFQVEKWCMDTAFCKRALSDIQSEISTYIAHLKQHGATPQTCEMLSFTLMLYAQRMEKEHDCTVFYLAALLFSGVNLYALERFVINALKHNSSEDMTAFLETYLQTHGSAQASFILQGLCARLPALQGWQPPAAENLLVWA